MVVLQQKATQITAAQAIGIICEECGARCVDNYGSTMITEESETVVCESCWTVYEVSSQAFRVVCKIKCKAKGEYH